MKQFGQTLMAFALIGLGVLSFIYRGLAHRINERTRYGKKADSHEGHGARARDIARVL